MINMISSRGGSILEQIINLAGEKQVDFRDGILQALTEEIADAICEWEYEKPYSVYSFKGHPNEYLLRKDTWGTEQFCMVYGDKVVGQVACQFDNDDLWVGWSLAPAYCGQGNGHLFVSKCVEEIRKIMKYKSSIYLRVAESNGRAISAYKKAGFVYEETIQDEIAYSNYTENFWIMVMR